MTKIWNRFETDVPCVCGVKQMLGEKVLRAEKDSGYKEKYCGHTTLSNWQGTRKHD